MVEKRCYAYLDFVRDVSADTPTVELVLVVREFPDMFPADLPGMPLDKDIDFGIDLVSGTQLIFFPPYSMALEELKELMEHLQKFLNKGFIRPRTQLKSYENNYPVHDFELAVIAHAFKICRHYHYGMSCKVFTDHRSLQHLFRQRDLNLRQWKWLEILNDYDITILYHLGKANVVFDALSWKAASMGGLSCIPVEESC
ncbi:uncharacterized protein [Nicotiana tomentosiformis]|uniref:uncharacterized protein n=1 Tax=Nicotiana tomentosiformis TaxID=4098 RepID=UPI00388C4B68